MNHFFLPFDRLPKNRSSKFLTTVEGYTTNIRRIINNLSVHMMAMHLDTLIVKYTPNLCL